MPQVLVVRRPDPRSLYRLIGGRDEFTITLADAFWSEGICDGDGSDLERNIDAICEELKYALYYVAVCSTPGH